MFYDRTKVRRVYKFLDAKFGMKTLSEKRLKISTLDDLNDPFELLPFGMADKTNRIALNQARKIWGTEHGILCFSASWHDPVVWAHYSDKHRGLCLGFEIPEEVGTEVRYISERLLLPQKLAPDDATAWVFTKYENWSYEQEIRCCARLDEPSDGLYFMAFGETLKLVEVIVGARCDLTEQMVSEVLRPFWNVPIIKARAGFSRFEIVEDRRGFPQ